MKRQTRPFTVEVKRKRTVSKRGRSIWGDLDLSAIDAETKSVTEEIALPNRKLIDSKMTPIDAENSFKPQVEHLMADLKEAEPAQTNTDASTTGGTPVTKKSAPRPKTAKAQPKRAPKTTVAPTHVAAVTPAAIRRKIYSDKERAQLLGQIEKAVASGSSSKSAIKQAGISEQTYYHWKRSKAPAPANSDLKDLLALEEENIRLKKLLAERLRNENAELKKKLGLN
ncbi:transposase [Mesorhizobium sp. SB112]|uniref:transposase n=1 Tax=Mesorhizobium sp. SB112 TaxID=3151853 RepID=UPI003264DB02